MRNPPQRGRGSHLVMEHQHPHSELCASSPHGTPKDHNSISSLRARRCCQNSGAGFSFQAGPLEASEAVAGLAVILAPGAPAAATTTTRFHRQ